MTPKSLVKWPWHGWSIRYNGSQDVARVMSFNVNCSQWTLIDFSVGHNDNKIQFRMAAVLARRLPPVDASYSPEWEATSVPQSPPASNWSFSCGWISSPFCQPDLGDYRRHRIRQTNNLWHYLRKRYRVNDGRDKDVVATPEGGCRVAGVHSVTDRYTVPLERSSSHLPYIT